VNKKAVGYTRVSTLDQASEGVSLAMQEAKIKLYCELHDLELTKIKEDAGISGKSIKGRPGIQEILEMIKGKETQNVVIYKLDRLARNMKEACEISELMQANEVNLHSVSESIDTGSATGTFFFHIMSAVAQWERGIISERTRSGLRFKKSIGQKIGRYFPMGKKQGEQSVTAMGKVVSQLIPDERELEAIEKAKQYHQLGLPIREVAMQLFREGYVSPRSGKIYSTSAIARMLSRFAGVFVVGIFVSKIIF
jgi:site-specific DNA recombinase